MAEHVYEISEAVYERYERVSDQLRVAQFRGGFDEEAGLLSALDRVARGFYCDHLMAGEDVQGLIAAIDSVNLRKADPGVRRLARQQKERAWRSACQLQDEGQGLASYSGHLVDATRAVVGLLEGILA